MKTKTSRKIFPHEAPALIFDWSPDGKHLACVLGTEASGRTPARTAMASGSVSPMRTPPRGGTCRARTMPRQAELGSLLEQLRAAARPGRPMAGRLPSSPIGKERLRVTPVNRGSGSVRLAGRRVEEVARTPARLRDLHWSPRGEMLGLVRGRD